MRAVTKHEFLFLLYLVSLSVVAMAPVGVFLGIGFLLLAPPDRAASPAESVSRLTSNQRSPICRGVHSRPHSTSMEFV
jgi:hypothetical protein